jgi:putative phosphoesterase
VILHGGDVLVEELLHELRGFAPTYAVLGNNDGELFGVLPETRQLDLGGVEVAMIHDSGPSKGREARMRRRFPSAGVVVFGHSHIPINRPGLDGQLLFNPGSPTERRMQPHQTIGILELDDGRVLDHRVEIVGP